jgi:hypothetical protein
MLPWGQGYDEVGLPVCHSRIGSRQCRRNVEPHCAFSRLVAMRTTGAFHSESLSWK